jgi:hypothetical protein
MHLGFKVKLGIFHVKSDSPAERRRKRAAKRKRRDARLKRRAARRLRFRQWVERRAVARWGQRVREPVVASTQPRAARDDAKARQRAARTAAARADATRVISGSTAAPQDTRSRTVPTGASGWPAQDSPPGKPRAWEDIPGDEAPTDAETLLWLDSLAAHGDWRAAADADSLRERAARGNHDGTLGTAQARARQHAPEQPGGTCGARTEDGKQCRNGAGCSIPAHVRQRSGAAR